jgi:hypothetical protein
MTPFAPAARTVGAPAAGPLGEVDIGRLLVVTPSGSAKGIETSPLDQWEVRRRRLGASTAGMCGVLLTHSYPKPVGEPLRYRM